MITTDAPIKPVISQIITYLLIVKSKDNTEIVYESVPLKLIYKA